MFYSVHLQRVQEYLLDGHHKSHHEVKREVLLDDYFKFLFDKKICKVHCYKLNNYVHVGSIKEYSELKYWENYFIDENKRSN